MVSFNVKPSVKVAGPIDNPTDITGSVTASTTHKDLDLSVKVEDRAVRNGVTKNGVTFTIEKKKAFKIEYDLGTDSPAFTFDTSATVSDKTVKLKYKAAAKKGTSSIEAAVALDSKHTATVTYDLSGFTLDAKRANLKWTYAHDDDLTLEPEFNFNTEKVKVSATYKLDADSKVKASYCQLSDTVGVEYTNTKIAGDNSELKASVNTNINKVDPRVAVTVERTFDFN